MKDKTVKNKKVLEITYYTDPLCCWSRVLEPEWQKFLRKYGSQVNWHYAMGGLIPDWDHYHDSLNSVARPAQMGPLWLDAMRRSGIPFCYNLWVEDPPSSSYPACLAVKSAEMQSCAAGQLYFERTRDAAMEEGRNIARWEVLADIARELSGQYPAIFNADRFIQDLRSEACREAFRKDLEKARYYGIKRFPTLVFFKLDPLRERSDTPGSGLATPAGSGYDLSGRQNRQKGIVLTGYRTFEVLEAAFEELAADKPREQQSVGG